MILDLEQGLLGDGITVSLTKFCGCFEVPLVKAYDKPVESSPDIDTALEEPIWAIPLVATARRCRAADQGERIVRISHGCLAAWAQREQR